MSDQHPNKSLYRSFGKRWPYSGRRSAQPNFVFMTMILFQLNFYTDVFGPERQRRRGEILLGPAIVGRFFRPIMGVPRRPHPDALGPVPAVGAVDLHSVGGGDDPGLHDAEGLEPGSNGRLCRDQPTPCS